MVLHHGMAINQFNRRWLDNVMATAITNIFFLKHKHNILKEKNIANFHEQEKDNFDSFIRNNYTHK